MGIVQDYLNTTVHTDKSRMFQVSNIMTEDFSFSWSTSETDSFGQPIPPMVFTIPAGMSLTFPADIGMYACRELAKKIVYKQNPKLGIVPSRWIEVAESLITEIGGAVQAPAQKTQAEIIKEKVDAVNAPVVDDIADIDVKPLDKNELIKQLEEKGFKPAVKNSIVDKTYSKASGVNKLNELLTN